MALACSGIASQARRKKQGKETRFVVYCCRNEAIPEIVEAETETRREHERGNTPNSHRVPEER